ncbi:GRIP1-associated protein 1-like isoform X2 [Mizuhopecten yessoensis]|uniref:GRIP1-associated protein 1-like isoform X2 n=1 Tax=Mizuhopecten yessoensis TaxID=6573 RepID=UPI000B45F672|nr:GRIP1-associated protein 1-like isoform X2 [Mizuhopecten yessoensis]
MASSLSEEEFHRMQLQLIDLRTVNYELEGKCKKQEREISIGVEKTDQLAKDLQKANKAIQKSKKAKDVEILLQENDTLQRKLESQEDDFRLQNETLMAELTTLVAANEDLEKKVKSGRGPDVADSLNASTISETDDEIRHLKAQNAALQKNLTAYKEKYERQMALLSPPSSPEKSSEQSDAESQPMIREDPSEGTVQQDGMSPQKPENKPPVNHMSVTGDLSSEINDLMLNLDTEMEEKRILKDQLTNLEKNFKEKISAKQDELDKLSEKLKKKQESYNQLQVEKEQLFRELSNKTEEFQSARDRDQKYYTDQVSRHQQDAEKLKQALDEKEKSSHNTIAGLQRRMASLQQQVDAASIVGNQQLQEETTKHRQQIEGLLAQVASLQQSGDDLTVQLEASKQACQETLEQLYAVQKDRDTRIQEWQEANKIAEKRKSMLDELANTYQRDNASHQDKLRQQEEAHDTEITALQAKLVTEQGQSAECVKLRQQVDELKAQNQSVEEAKGWLERRLQQSEQSLKEKEEENTATLSHVEAEHASVLTHLREENQEQLDSLKEKYKETYKLSCDKEESLKAELNTYEKEINQLKQEIADSVDDRKIHEKKGLTMLKDLKRQLHSERKRAEKLQDKLQETLSESQQGKTMEDMFGSFDGDTSLREDRSSVSSWSVGASLPKDLSNTSGPQSPDRLQSPLGDFEHEHNDLVSRLAELQQEKWNMEEKLSHLEMSTGAMAEDLITKTKIIEHYVMDSRTDPKPHSASHEDKLTLKKVLDLVNRSDEQGLKEMNRKLQRMLEETLTKNMHLQKDLEMLSEEVVRLSKVQHTGTQEVGQDGSQQKNTSEETVTMEMKITQAT